MKQKSVLASAGSGANGSTLPEPPLCVEDVAIRSVLMNLVGFEGPGKVTPSGLCPWVWVDGLTITGDA